MASARRGVDSLIALMEGLHPPSSHTSPTVSTKRRVPHLTEPQWQSCKRPKGNRFYMVRSHEEKQIPLRHDDLIYIGEHHEYEIVWTKMTCTLDRLKNSVLAEKWKGECILYNVTPTRGEKACSYYFMPMDCMESYMQKWYKVDDRTLAQRTDSLQQDGQDLDEADTDLERSMEIEVPSVSLRQPSNLPARLHLDSDQFEYQGSRSISPASLSDFSESILVADEGRPFEQSLRDEAQTAAQQLQYSLDRTMPAPANQNGAQRSLFLWSEQDHIQPAGPESQLSQPPAIGGGEGDAQSIQNPPTPPPSVALIANSRA